MPGMRRRVTPTRCRRPHCRSICSASTRRRARGVDGSTGLVSATHAPAQSPYTPVVEPYTNWAGGVRLANAQVRCRVRGSRVPSPPPSEGGGARCRMRVAIPLKRRNERGSSRSPSSGTTPCDRSASRRDGEDVKASNPMRRPAPSTRVVRTPTSPQPMISTRSRRNRAGKAPYSPMRVLNFAKIRGVRPARLAPLHPWRQV